MALIDSAQPEYTDHELSALIIKELDKIQAFVNRHKNADDLKFSYRDRSSFKRPFNIYVIINFADNFCFYMYKDTNKGKKELMFYSLFFCPEDNGSGARFYVKFRDERGNVIKEGAYSAFDVLTILKTMNEIIDDAEQYSSQISLLNKFRS